MRYNGRIASFTYTTVERKLYYTFKKSRGVFTGVIFAFKGTLYEILF
jgi:hypothetical protein